MQPAIIDFLEVERERAFEITLNIDGYDMAGSNLELSVRLLPELEPVLKLEDLQIIREVAENETGWVVKVSSTAESMKIEKRSYKYELVDITTDITIIKGCFNVI